LGLHSLFSFPFKGKAGMGMVSLLTYLNKTIPAHVARLGRPILAKQPRPPLLLRALIGARTFGSQARRLVP